jgi:EpsI family protein
MRSAAVFVPVFFLAQAGLVFWASGAEHPPAIPDLARFPAQFGDWKSFYEDPIADDVRQQLQADQLVSRTYSRKQGAVANLFVAWFQTQSQGARQPHSPQVCLPGAGWTPIITDRVRLDAGGQTADVNRYVVSLGGQKAVVLYWYQTAKRMVASEWASKFWTVWDALSVQRTDIALVRVVTWPGAGGDYQKATELGLTFARDMYPALREALPR